MLWTMMQFEERKQNHSKSLFGNEHERVWLSDGNMRLGAVFVLPFLFCKWDSYSFRIDMLFQTQGLDSNLFVTSNKTNLAISDMWH